MRKKFSFIYDWLNIKLLRSVNRWLAIAAAALAALFMLDVMFVSPKNDWKRQEPKLAAIHKKSRPAPKEPGAALLPKTESLEDYSKTFAGQNMFGPAPANKKTAAESSLSNLALVGILLGDNPQAILEDKTTQMIYYLSKNQTVSGMTVEDIQEKKVVLKYKGESVTFTL